MLLLGFVLLLTGVSYAYWKLTRVQTGVNELASSCFDIAITNEQNAINLQKAAPISDEEGSSLTPFTFTITNNCDTYASYAVNLELLTSVLEANRLSAGFVKVMLDENTPIVLNTNKSVTPTLSDASEAYELTTGYLDANQSVNYSLRLWMDSAVTVEDDAMNKQLDSKITVTASYLDHLPSDYDLCVSKYGADSIQCTILAEANTEESGPCPTINEDGSVNVTSAESTNAYLCSAEDDYGTSYYYRGTPTNNWVKFANAYWRIVRINGDGSIRLIYAGNATTIDSLDETTKASVLANGYNDASTNYTQIGTSYYNYYWKKDNVQESVNSRVDYDNAGVGYMYGNRDGVVEGSTQYSTYSHSSTATRYYADSYTCNESTGQFSLVNPTSYTGAEVTTDFVGKYTGTSSTTIYGDRIYKVLNVSVGTSSTTVGYSYVTYGTTSKAGAQTNTNDSTIKDTIDNWYEANILGTEYEQYISDTLFCNDRSVVDYGETDYSNLAYGPERTTYRWYNGPYDTNKNYPTLKCAQQNDRFTVNDIETGNGSLTYPVALITTDEAHLAGGYNVYNLGYYLYTGNSYWTMSPSSFFDSDASVRYFYSDGFAGNGWVTYSLGVRPAINLKAGSLTKGTGVATDPYQV